MAGDLVIEEGDLEVLRDRTRDLSSRLQSVTVATAGIAMRSIGKDVVDDFVYTGSPGSAVRSVGTLGVDPEHTWVSAIPLHDEVQGMGFDGSFGRDPKELEGIGHLSGDATGADGYNSDPNADKYANHSAYFYKAKEGQHNYSLEDIGKVIAGTKER